MTDASQMTTFQTTVTPRLYAIWLCKEVARAQAACDRAYALNVMAGNRREKMSEADAKIDMALNKLKALHEAELTGKVIEIRVRP